MNKDSLEKQLELLFSDTTPPEPQVRSSRYPEFVKEAPKRTQPPPQAKDSHSSGTKRLFWRKWPIRGLARVTESLGVVSIFGWVLVVAFTLMEHAGASGPAITTAPVTAVARVSTATARPTKAVTVVPTATVVPATPTTSKTPTTDVGTSSATSTSTPTAAPPTATATPTPLPTAVPATPTFAHASHVFTATTTPVRASAIGLSGIPTPVPLIAMPDDAINIVLLGSDQRPYETQWRTDVVIVVSINPKLPSVSMLSIPRDTWLYIPNWTYQRINLADVHGSSIGYPGGGPGLIKATIEYNFGIHVDYFARVNFAGLIKIVDTLGGIDVLLDCPVEDGFPDDPITEDPSVVTQISYPEPGVYHIDGKHALWLSRSRKTTSEFARSRRQHRVLSGIWNKANELGFITNLPELWEDLTATVQTDLTLEQVVWLASIGLQLEPSQVNNGFIDGRYMTAWVSPGGANVLRPHTEAILEAIEPLFNPYPYQAPQGFSKVEVWNGSGHEGWGYLAADRLLRNGFEVTDIREADKVYEHSTLLDFSATTKGSPLPRLQELFDASVARAPAEAEASSGVAFRLIVGADYQPCEWPTPARWSPPTPTPPTPQPQG